MKSLLLFLLPVVMFGVSCVALDSEKPVEAPKQILEIWQDPEGLFDVTGKSLFIRLYDNHLVEFEYLNPAKYIPGEIRQIEDVKCSMQIYLDDDEFQKISGFAKAVSSDRVGIAYEHKCCCTDTNLSMKIRVSSDSGEKNVALRYFCDFGELEHPQDRYVPNYPNALGDLISYADIIRAKNTPK